jgi:predicted DNA-binding WGR domain protein
MYVKDTPPMWVRYAEYVRGGSDKFYEIRVDMDDNGAFQVTARWGRRPDSGGGQAKVYDYVPSMGIATGHANELMRAKLRKGYCETERPKWANSLVSMDERYEDV